MSMSDRRRVLLCLHPAFWVGFASGLWQRRRRLWVSYRTRPVTWPALSLGLLGMSMVFLLVVVWVGCRTPAPGPRAPVLSPGISTSRDDPGTSLAPPVMRSIHDNQMLIYNMGPKPVRCAPAHVALAQHEGILIPPLTTFTATPTQGGPSLHNAAWRCLAVDGG
jgi:hypothetical protein